MGVCVYGYVYVSPSESMCGNVTISRSESMAQIFRHIVISTHQNVEMSRAETMWTFSMCVCVCGCVRVCVNVYGCMCDCVYEYVCELWGGVYSRSQAQDTLSV